MIVHVLGIAAAAAYLAAAVLQLQVLVGRVTRERRRDMALTGMWAGVVCHSCLLFVYALGAAPVLPVEPARYLAWLAWLLAVAYLAAPARFKSPLLGFFVSAAAAIVFASSSVLVHAERPKPEGSEASFVFFVHVLPILLCQASLALGGAAGAGYLLKDYWLRTKSVKTLDVRGPSLEALALLNVRALRFGLWMMTLGMLTGFVWAVSRDQRLFGGDLAQWQALVAWFALAALLHAREAWGWPERRVARGTIALAVVLIVANFVSLVVLGRGGHAGVFS